MIHLAIETSGRAGGVAVQRDEQPLVERLLSGDRRHTPELLPIIAETLAAVGAALRDVTLVSWSRGPGSFTGLRIGATVVRMTAQVADCRIVGVSSLEACALGVPNAAASGPEPAAAPAAGRRFAAVIVDAKRAQVFGAGYELPASGEVRAVVPPGLYLPAELFAAMPGPFWITGEGIAKHAAACAAAEGGRGPLGVLAPADSWSPRPGAVLALGRRAAEAGFCDAVESVVPEYIRPPECEEFYELRRAEAIRKRAERERA